MVCLTIPEEIHAGATIAYYTRMFVLGDKRGYREAVVLREDDRNEGARQLEVDIDEMTSTYRMINSDVYLGGRRVSSDEAKWRTLRTFTIVNDTYDAPTRSTSFRKAVRRLVSNGFASLSTLNTHAYEEMANEVVPDSLSLHVNDGCYGETANVYSSPSVASSPRGGGNVMTVNNKRGESEEISTKSPTALHLTRHQPKKRADQWTVHRSHKRCNQKKCAITRSGSQIYHASTLKAKKTKTMLRLPRIKPA
ncbi:Set domain-containing hypothetical protein [Phytophthora megakarya]|uniref:Uncharacterized protein n=1 Tax=Phytophthora megakarya TaxID=4795 RepID=A0A225WWW5_9STRA|nr:Set domain-containing hypothetical protein [Phytophthora megakarya]